MADVEVVNDLMTDRRALEALFLSHLTLIDRIVSSIIRRHPFLDDPQDFASWVRLRLIDNDYAILGKFRGECAVGAYLTVVIAQLFRDYRVNLIGRWRPSTAAIRKGAAAVRLETLIFRDRMPIRQAIEQMLAANSTHSARELWKLVAELPPRSPLRPQPVSSDALEYARALDEADGRLVEEELRMADETAKVLLEEALGRLQPEDRLVLRMRYYEGLSVPEIAGILGEDVKRLYRRIERLIKRVREDLEQAGFSRESHQQWLETRL